METINLFLSFFAAFISTFGVGAWIFYFVSMVSDCDWIAWREETPGVRAVMLGTFCIAIYTFWIMLLNLVEAASK